MTMDLKTPVCALLAPLGIRMTSDKVHMREMFCTNMALMLCPLDVPLRHLVSLWH